MHWKKIKNIFCPQGEHRWMLSHAANPYGIHLHDSIFRVFFTTRDHQNRSFIGSVDIDFLSDFKVINISQEPLLSPGELGLFDDSGVAMCYYLEIENIPHIYYLGWNLKVTVPWLNTIGLAKFNKDTGLFAKVSRAPIMDRSNEDPFSISYPGILFKDGIYKMWYGSNLRWGKEQHEMQHIIKYAESSDGIHWNRTNLIVLNLEHPNEYAISKPFVLHEDNVYKMWYSYRANGVITTYRIGYAESNDGLNWIRKDEEAGIDVSMHGWDSEMICYPSIIDYANKKYMLYNGNGYGRTGFGIAELLR